MQEMWVWSLGQEDPLVKEMATHSSIIFFFFHSSILAWRIPWTKEPDSLHSTGSQKSWTSLSDQTTTATTTIWVLNCWFYAYFECKEIVSTLKAAGADRDFFRSSQQKPQKLVGRVTICPLFETMVEIGTEVVEGEYLITSSEDNFSCGIVSTALFLWVEFSLKLGNPVQGNLEQWEIRNITQINQNEN